MNQSQLEQFVARLRSDQELRRRVEEAEREAVARSQRVKDEIDRVNQENLAALQSIAAEYGLDLSLDESGFNRLVRPSDQELEHAWCLLTCCWLGTSVYVPGDIPDGPPFMGPGCIASTGMPF